MKFVKLLRAVLPMLCLALAVLPMAADTTVGDFTYKLNSTDKIARITGRAKEAEKAYNLTIPSTITYKNVTYKVTIVNAKAFYGDYYIRKLTLGDNVQTIGESAFESTTITTIVSFGKKLQTIGNRAFYSSSVTSMAAIPATVTSIGDLSFGNCTGLTAVNFTVPAKITAIGYQAFWNCTGLKTIALPGSLQSIGEECFKLCEGLTSVSFLSGTGKAFVGIRCFDNLQNITSVTFGEPSVGTFGMAAFINCGISSLTLPSSCTSVGEDAFSSNRLSVLKLNEGLKTIDPYAFESQYVNGGLKELVIPSTVTSIGTYAFKAVGDKMTSITCKATVPPTATAGAFSSYNQMYTPLYVPDASVNAYKTAEVWKDFRYIYGINSAIDDVAADMPESDLPVKWYDLQGQQVNPDDVPSGVYIRRQGGNVTKVTIP